MLRRSLSNITGMIETTPRHDTRHGTARHARHDETSIDPARQRLAFLNYSDLAEAIMLPPHPLRALALTLPVRFEAPTA